jgi:multiple sugar transport system permease protein
MSANSRVLRSYLINALMLFFGLLAIVPIYVLLINASRTTEQINSGLTLFPGLDAFFPTTETVKAEWESLVINQPMVSDDQAIEAEAEELEDIADEYMKSKSFFLDADSGLVIYRDLTTDSSQGLATLKEVTNSKGEKEKYVFKALTESRSPRIAIVNGEGELLVNYNLSNNAQIFVDDGQVIKKGALIARTVTPPNIVYNWRALTGRGFKIWLGFGNSAFIAICATLLSIYFSAMTAYGLHIYNFKGRTFIWGIILLIMMLPGSLTFIGFYQLMASWKLIGTYFPLILPGIAAAATVLFIRQYMSSVLNKELIDAARIDGAGEFSIFNVVILPVIVPALAAQSIFTFVGSWNNYLVPAIILGGNEKMHTLPMLMMALRGDIYRTEYGGIYLGIAVSLIPIMIFYSFMSRFIISGITMGGIKE